MYQQQTPNKNQRRTLGFKETGEYYLPIMYPKSTPQREVYRSCFINLIGW